MLICNMGKRRLTTDNPHSVSHSPSLHAHPVLSQQFSLSAQLADTTLTISGALPHPTFLSAPIGLT